MENIDYQEDDFLRQVNFDEFGQLDWDNLFTELPHDSPLFLNESSSHSKLCESSPDSLSSWIGQIETMLMKDDDWTAVEPTKQVTDDFLADILVDSPADGSAEVVCVSTDKDLAASDDGHGGASDTDKEREMVPNDGGEAKNDADEDADDPISKKRRRQLRNRDAAVRSRERKKMYVRDLETKSRYLEGECRRLGRLLQCFIAENQALRLSLQKGSAFGVSSTKQESAVLSLESLLLGSLLWFLGIMCVFTLPKLPQSTLVALPQENVEEKVAERGAGSRMLIQSFVNSRRCKASRTRMKLGSVFIGVMV